MRRFTSLTVVVAAIVVLAMVGGLFGGKVLAQQELMSRHFDSFASALSAVEANYVDDVETDRLVYSAIRGMLQTLDPHSNFMDPRSYAQLLERQEGRYYGLGISINVIDGRITVMSLFEGSPAYRIGIRGGDVIARIEGENSIGMSSEQAVRRLRGPRGSSVNISILRAGFEELIDLDVERDEITIPTVNVAFMVDDQTGYVRLSDFSETSNDELSRALKRLKDEGMGQLMLDLRNNPGGPLDQAIGVSNQFLPRDDMIVYTRGRVENSDQDYHARSDSEFDGVPIIVLVNRSSASAAEIVAGALQDHDRALIVGETTFGKALVQSVYRVSHGAGLALTSARYYTPSGRMIQRPWDGTFDEYLTYSLREQKTLDHSLARRKFTAGGREVYSGGGIEPDYFLSGPIIGFDPSRLGRLLTARGEFARFARRFSAEGDDRISIEGVERKVVSPGFSVDDAMLAEFRGYVAERQLTVDEDDFHSDMDFIRAMIHYEVDLALFGESAARQNLFWRDPQVQFALPFFDEARRLLDLSGESVVVAAR